MGKRKADIVPITAATLAKAARRTPNGDFTERAPAPSAPAHATPAPPPAVAASLPAAAEAPAAAATSHAHSALLVRYFSCLDAVVYSLQRRSSEGAWKLVQRGVDLMMSSGGGSNSSGAGFTLEALSLILSVFPRAYVVEWKYLAIDSLAPVEHHLCISINTNTSGDNAAKASSTGASATVLLTKDMNTEARIQAFRDRLSEYVASHGGGSSPDDAAALQISSGAIPPKPDAAAVMSQSMRTLETARKLTKMVEEKRLRSSQELLSQPSQGVDAMEQLRLLAIERGKKQAELSKASAATRVVNERDNQLRSLPAVADSLRSLVRVKSRMLHPLQDILSSLAPQLQLTKQALLARLALLAEVAPEFVSLFAANDVVPVATLKVNMDAPYGTVRGKLSALPRSVKV